MVELHVSRPTCGPPTRRRQKGDVGITAQRYSLVLYGNAQRLKIEPWEPETARTVTMPFAWKPDTWYHLKLRVENLPNGKVRARGKAWPTGEAEPAAWMIDKIDPIGNRQGAAGLLRRRRVRRACRQPEGRGQPVAKDIHEVHVTHHVGCSFVYASSCCSSQSAWQPGRVSVGASDPGTGDWPMWGGTPDRNMVSSMKGLPTEWDVKTKKNVKWVAELGSQSYGNPGRGRRHGVRRHEQRGAARSEAAGRPRRADGVPRVGRRVPVAADAPEARVGPRQRLAVSGRRQLAARRGRAPLLRQQPRRRLWCLDIKGFRDGENDGPMTDEKLTGEHDADVIWSFDMMEEVGSYPHNMSNSSPVIWGDLIFVSTSNGQDESHVNIPSPRAPAIIALNKNTGKLVWEDNSVEDRILHGQWSTPSVGRIGGVDQVVSGAGRRLGARVRSGDRQEAVGVRHQPEGLRLAAERATR